MSPHEKAVEAVAHAIYGALPNFSTQWQPNTAGGYSQHRVDEPYGIDGVRSRQCEAQARAAISAYLESMREQGWVMVPKKATDAMQRAGISTIAEACRDGDIPVSWQVWDDMLDAAMLAAQESRP